MNIERSPLSQWVLRLADLSPPDITNLRLPVDYLSTVTDTDLRKTLTVFRLSLFTERGQTQADLHREDRLCFHCDEEAGTTLLNTM